MTRVLDEVLHMTIIEDQTYEAVSKIISRSVYFLLIFALGCVLVFSRVVL